MTFDKAGYVVERGTLQAWSAGALHTELGDKRLSMPHRTHERVLDTMRQARLVGTVKALLGGEVSGLGSNYYARSPGMGWHKDNEYILARPESMLSVWIPLQDVGEWNALEVVPGSHHHGLKYGALTGLPIGMEAGDALFMHGDLAHRSGHDGHDKRPALLFTYIKQGWPFRPGLTEQRSEVEL